MKNALTCPYCKAEQCQHEPEPFSVISSNEITCELCGKAFWYSVAVIREYHSYQMPQETGASQ